jgi:hypothetical protein
MLYNITAKVSSTDESVELFMKRYIASHLCSSQNCKDIQTVDMGPLVGSVFMKWSRNRDNSGSFAITINTSDVDIMGLVIPFIKTSCINEVKGTSLTATGGGGSPIITSDDGDITISWEVEPLN